MRLSSAAKASAESPVGSSNRQFGHRPRSWRPRWSGQKLVSSSGVRTASSEVKLGMGEEGVGGEASNIGSVVGKDGRSLPLGERGFDIHTCPVAFERLE